MYISFYVLLHSPLFELEKTKFFFSGTNLPDPPPLWCNNNSFFLFPFSFIFFSIGGGVRSIISRVKWGIRARVTREDL